VLIAKILIYVPSIANFRENWIEQKIAEANIAILVLEAAPDYIVSHMLTDKLLGSTDNFSIMRRFDDGMDPQVLRSMEPFEVSARFDIRNTPSALASVVCGVLPSSTFKFESSSSILAKRNLFIALYILPGVGQHRLQEHGGHSRHILI